MKRPPGRPPLDDVAATSRVQLRVTPAQRLELRRVADENGTGMSGVIREAVNEYVSDYRDKRRRKVFSPTKF
jgi:hypothetical protein